MIARLHVNGYKSLHNTEVVLSPFTVIVGLNNTGKSNLFDLLRLLSAAAQGPLDKAFKSHRGDPVETFRGPVDGTKPQFEVTLDLNLAGAHHPDDASKPLEYTMLRYQIAIAFDHQRGLLIVVNEHLEDINPVRRERRKNPFVDVVEHEGERKIRVVPEHRGKPRLFPLGRERSVLTLVDDAEFYPSVCAVQRELASWKFFHFDPAALREPSRLISTLELGPKGEDLSGFFDTLLRLEEYNPTFRAIERQIQRAIPEVERLEVVDTGDKRRLLALRQKEGQQFTARVVSDGTLRFLALLALAYSPQPAALVCFEEPENGVHPRRLKFVTDLLRGIARERPTGPRSQVLVNSHSPYLVDHLQPEEMVVATLEDGITKFRRVGDTLFAPDKVNVRKMLEDGEVTLGELFYQGDLDASS